MEYDYCHHTILWIQCIPITCSFLKLPVTDLAGSDITRAQLNGAGTKRVAGFTALERPVDFSLRSLRIVVLG
jgi:hypothetical protein